MQAKAISIFAAAVLICLIPVTASALTPYAQDFEDLLQTDGFALSADGWVVYGNVYDSSMTWMYGYGVFPAPNNNLAFSNIVIGEGGDEQGLQQLSIFSDYESAEHAAGNWVESNVFHEQTIVAGDVGQIWRFAFQAKRGNIAGASTAAAFIKTIDPTNGYAMTNLVTADMTAIPDVWGGYSVQLEIIPELVGQLFQFGFMCVATNYESSGIFYDNIDFNVFDPTDVPLPVLGATLRPNYPNPFNPSTRIAFSLERGGVVDLGVYDLSGRRIATLVQGDLPAGEHAAIWNGRADDGAAVASGQYRYVLETASGRTSRSMVLLK